MYNRCTINNTGYGGLNSRNSNRYNSRKRNYSRKINSSNQSSKWGFGKYFLTGLVSVMIGAQLISYVMKPKNPKIAAVPEKKIVKIEKKSTLEEIAKKYHDIANQGSAKNYYVGHPTELRPVTYLRAFTGKNPHLIVKKLEARNLQPLVEEMGNGKYAVRIKAKDPMVADWLKKEIPELNKSYRETLNEHVKVYSDEHIKKLTHEKSKEKGLDPKLGYAITKRESNFNPEAIAFQLIPRNVKEKNGRIVKKLVVKKDKNGNPEKLTAIGPMQINPLSSIVESQGFTMEDLFDAEINIDIGTTYLKNLVGKYPIKLAIAAYNCGEAVIADTINYEKKKKNQRGNLTERVFRHLPYETRVFTKDVLANYKSNTH